MNSKIFKVFGALSLTMLILCSCNKKDIHKNLSEIQNDTLANLQTPVFNGDSAFSYLKDQVSFGPRVPNTSPHQICLNYILTKLKSFGVVPELQNGTVQAFNSTVLSISNVIISFNPQNKNRILLTAHWDTRPFADQDTADKNKPIPGANDGASGVAVLLEISRQMSVMQPYSGVDIVLLDAEDYGQPENKDLPEKSNTYCLGTQFWAKNYSFKYGLPQYCINLDMVGGKDAVFTFEGNSKEFAPELLGEIWNIGSKLGYGSMFKKINTRKIIDDHVYIAMIANIPSIDIIQYDPNTSSNFFKFWHTHKDDLNSIDKNTLKAVGQTLLELIFHSKLLVR